jgi:hypothetical protein
MDFVVCRGVQISGNFIIGEARLPVASMGEVGRAVCKSNCLNSNEDFFLSNREQIVPGPFGVLRESWP